MAIAVFKIVPFVTAAYSSILHLTKESSQPTLTDDMTKLNMDLPMPLSGQPLFFVTLRPGFEPRENIQILMCQQGIQGATCATILNSNNHLIKNTHVNIFPCASIPNSNTTILSKQHMLLFFLKQEQLGISLCDSGATFSTFYRS